jgi:hypothetical protein
MLSLQRYAGERIDSAQTDRYKPGYAVRYI